MKFSRKKIILACLIVIFIVAIAGILFLASRPPTGISSKIKWGVGFSKFFSIQMGLDWKENYLAILNDLKPRAVRLPIYWQDVEPQSEQYVFNDYDWMISEAEKRNIEILPVIGRKLPRWPECHVPQWIKNSQQSDKNFTPSQVEGQKLLEYIEKTVNHYKDNRAISAWQVENEPFLPFGECPMPSASFLDKEISLVRSLDPSRQIVVTDSGELSIWLLAAKRADIFGTTIYRIIWNRFIGYFKYPLPPKFFWLKANLVHLFYPEKPIIVSELQAEPWSPKILSETSLEDQAKSMDLGKFHDNIEYAKKVGFPEVYLWGAEWWYWMKIKNGNSDYWNYAREVMSNEK